MIWQNVDSGIQARRSTIIGLRASGVRKNLGGDGGGGGGGGGGGLHQAPLGQLAQALV